MGPWPSRITAEEEESKRWCRKWHTTVPQGLLNCRNTSTVLKPTNAVKDQLGHVRVLKLTCNLEEGQEGNLEC